MGSIFNACEGIDDNGSSFEGKEWVLEKVEARFDGKVVQTVPLSKNRGGFSGNLSTSLSGGHGQRLLLWERDESGSTLRTFSENRDTLFGGYTVFKVIKLTEKEMILDLLPDYSFGRPDGDLVDDFWLGNETIRPIATYNNKSIYSSDLYLTRESTPRWYYNEKHTPIQCDYNERTNERREVWIDTYDEYYDIILYDYDYWFDTERYYLNSK